jgi:histidyl-tRNA synthetase
MDGILPNENEAEVSAGEDGSDQDSSEALSTRVLPGFMELEPRAQLAFERMKRTIRDVYERFGYTPVETPAIERVDVLLAKTAGETSKQMYRLSRTGQALGLRFDLTVPLARYVTEHYGSLSFPFRAYQIGKVYRGERPQKGRFRELYQCDVDMIGTDQLSLMADAEMLAIGTAALSELGVSSAAISMNNRKLLSGLLLEVDPNVNTPEALRTIDKLEKIGAAEVESQLVGLGLPQEGVSRLLSVIDRRGAAEEILSFLDSVGMRNPLFHEGVRELRELASYVESIGVDNSRYSIDLSIARGLDYDTGTVFETHLENAREIGSICSGGRYDNLVGTFSSHKLPGVGISIGLTRLFDQWLRNNPLEAASSTTLKVMVLPMLEDLRPAAELASFLRGCGVPTAVETERAKLRNKLKLANRIGVPFVVIVGEDELQSGKYSLKEMQSGEQRTMTRAEMAAYLQERV